MAIITTLFRVLSINITLLKKDINQMHTVIIKKAMMIGIGLTHTMTMILVHDHLHVVIMVGGSGLVERVNMNNLIHHKLRIIDLHVMRGGGVLTV